MIATMTLSRLAASPRLVFWLYLVLIGAAELLTAVVSTPAGLLLHAALLITLTLHGSLAEDRRQRALALALLLAPLIRLLSLTLPLLRVPQIAWYPLVSLPLMVAMLVVIRQCGVTRGELGLRRGRLGLELLMIGFGFGLGAVEYTILRPDPLVARAEWLPLLLASLSLLVFTGFTEELLFRGLTQSATLPVIGRGALVYGALLFGVLHIGYLSLVDFAFVVAVGLIFGALVLRTGSILGVTLAHGSTNITLFLLMPLAAADQTSVFAAVTWLLVWAGTVAGSVAMIAAYRYGSATPRADAVRL